MTSTTRRLLALGVLFAAYQAPEGVGGHWLHSFPVQAGLMLAFFPVAWLVARGLLGSGLASAYALAPRAASLARVPALLLLALAAKALAILAGLRLGIYALDPGAAGAAPSSLPAAAMGLAGIAFTTFWPSLAEDIVTRGYWYRQWPRLGRGAGFVLFSALVFVLNHVYRLGNGPLEWLMLFAFGLAYATALVRLDTLWAALGLHWGWNIGAFAAGDVFHVATADPARGPWLSIAAHALMLLAVLAATGRAGRRQPRPAVSS